ncbi:hypothetical protein E2562_002107 [Oryza meyeriana var. granulata]|uniref:Uncharacterized protein n=1 Tax=Oryza meyeriana var. granulata TaxID=110450 RepID=A0A6G1EDN0_9ORYZ|nr:hypothetical protein E2562_002107 [Oryza meyeriana var. granulata]
MQSSASATRLSSTSSAAKCAADKRPAADLAPLLACKKLHQGAGSPLGTSLLSSSNLATTLSSMPSPPTTVAETVGGVLSVSPATPRLALVVTESTLVTTAVVALRMAGPAPHHFAASFSTANQEVEGGF